MKILIADDDALFRKILTDVLAPGHELVMAKNGYDAWILLQSPDAPKLAILDWVMPGLTGPEICRNVRNCQSLSGTYLIIMTSRNSEADIVSGLRAGADDYITKPAMPAEIRARVTVAKRVLSLQETVRAQSALVCERLESGKGVGTIRGCLTRSTRDIKSESTLDQRNRPWLREIGVAADRD